VARIFHGIQSPRFPATEWYSTSFWGRYSTVDFYLIKKLATTALIDLKAQRRPSSTTTTTTTTTSSSSSSINAPKLVSEDDRD